MSCVAGLHARLLPHYTAMLRNVPFGWHFTRSRDCVEALCRPTLFPIFSASADSAGFAAHQQLRCPEGSRAGKACKCAAMGRVRCHMLISTRGAGGGEGKAWGVHTSV